MDHSSFGHPETKASEDHTNPAFYNCIVLPKCIVGNVGTRISLVVPASVKEQESPHCQ